MKAIIEAIKESFSSPIVTAGTILGTLAILVFLTSAFIKNKKILSLYQCLAHIFLIVSEGVSKLFSAVIQEITSLTRNLTVYFGKNFKWVNIVLISVATGLGIYANIFGTNFFHPWKGVDLQSWYSYLPVIANLQFSIVIMTPSLSSKWVKLSLGLNGTLWATCFLIQGGAVLFSGVLNGISGIVNFTMFAITYFKEKKNFDKVIIEENIN